MKKILFIVLLVVSVSNAWAHFPVIQRIGYQEFGFFPLCMQPDGKTHVITIAPDATIYILNQRREFTWDKASLNQAVDTILTANVTKYAEGKNADFPNLGIYERKAEEFNFASYAHQWNQYIRIKGQVPCWLQVSNVKSVNGFYVITGK